MSSEPLPAEFIALVREIHEKLTAPRVWIGPDPGVDKALFVDAVRYVLQERNSAVHLVQRNVRVGFAKAARLVDLMEAWGLVGPKTGPMAREVLVPTEAVDDVIAAITAQEGGTSR